MSLNSTDVLRNIINHNHEIQEITFVKFDNYNQLQDRIDIRKNLSKIYQNALNIKNNYSFPFWDCFNVSLFNQKINNFDFLEEIFFHNKSSKSISINKNEIHDFLSEIESKNEYWTLSSKVKLKNGESAHFFFLDYHIPISDSNEILCAQIANKLQMKGYLLDSGKSYHFYSENLISEEKLIENLARALMFAPIVDRAWIAHQLIERRCCLRISKKYDRLPLVLRFLGYE